ncbi:MAG: hypothetical protein AB7P04_13300 [Bacteriovoracia bacterium]
MKTYWIALLLGALPYSSLAAPHCNSVDLTPGIVVPMPSGGGIDFGEVDGIINNLQCFIDNVFPCTVYQNRCEDAIGAWQSIHQQISAAQAQLAALQGQLGSLLTALRNCRASNGFSNLEDSDPCLDLTHQVGDVMRRIGQLIHNVIPGLQSQLPGAADAAYTACVDNRPAECEEIALPLD